RAVELHPQDDWVQNSLGIAYSMVKQYEKAKTHFLKALLLSPEAVYYVNLADTHKVLENWDDALDYYLEAVSIDPNYHSAHNSIGIEYYYRKNYEKAIEHYQKAIAIAPENFVYHANLGDAYKKTKRIEEAVEAYQKALSLNSDDVLTLINLGEVFRGQQQFDEAEQYYLRALEAHKKQPGNQSIDIALNGLGIIYSIRRDYRAAEKYFQSAIEGNPQYSIYYSNLGDAYRNLQQYEKAIEIYEKAIALDENDDIVHNAMGVSYSYLKEFDSAIECYQKAININNSKAVYFLNLGDAFVDKGDLESAEIAYRTAVEKEPKNASAYESLASLLGSLGKYFQAMVNYQTAFELDKNPIHLSHIGHIYRRLGDYEQSIAFCQKAFDIAREQKDTNPRIPRYLGLAYNDRGTEFDSQQKYQLAIKDYQTALKYIDDDPVIFHNLYLSYISIEDWMNAMESLKRALELNPDNPVYLNEMEVLKNKLADA
ncbi:MAG: tetratricopeptide repeat protein, partial [Calditrichaeota bacterium]